MTLTVMNEQDQFVQYTDARTQAIAPVLMHIQGGIEKPCIFLIYQNKHQNGVGTLRLRHLHLLMRQVSISILVGKTIYRSNRS